jgi:hypothetical protein
VPVVAQVSRPTDPPIVTAENDSWYRLGEPLVFSGEFYYPAGPTVFFNGNEMVRTGHYNGVPVYADTTLEPYSIVLVPVGHGLMQPYERVRDGELAGTSGSRAPSFPGLNDRRPLEMLSAGGPPSNLPAPIGAISVYTPEAGAVATSGREAAPTTGIDTAPVRQPLRRVGKPFRYDRVSVQFHDRKWVMAGPSIPMHLDLVQVDEYKGFPVYAERGKAHDRIYLPIVPGLVAPFEPK